MSDWKIGDDRRRRSTEQLRDLNRANNDEVWWDTEAPADFTYLYHPHRIIVRAEDADEFDRAVGRLDKDTLPEPPRREDVGRRKKLARYVLAQREGRKSVPEILDQVEPRLACQVEIEQRHIDRAALDGSPGIGERSGRSDHREFVNQVQHEDQRFAERRVVVHDQDADHAHISSQKLNRAPWPGADSISRSAPCACRIRCET